MSQRVPKPPLNVRYDLRRRDDRYYLTGGLPAPAYRWDGNMDCHNCGHKVRAVLVDTHVEGARPVRMPVPHHCRTKATA